MYNKGSRAVGVPKGTVPLASLSLDTQSLGVGDYRLKVRLESEGRPTWKARARSICDGSAAIPSSIASGAIRPTTLTEKAFIDDLDGTSHGTADQPEDADMALRNGLRFIQRIEGGDGFPRALDPKKASDDVLARTETGESNPTLDAGSFHDRTGSCPGAGGTPTRNGRTDREVGGLPESLPLHPHQRRLQYVLHLRLVEVRDHAFSGADGPDGDSAAT